MRAPLLHAAVPALLALAACSGEIPGPLEVLTPAEVQGTYQLCDLRFTPVQAGLPAADVLAGVMEAAPPPVVVLGGTAPEFELAYVRRGGGARQLRGDVEFGAGSVFLYLHSRTASVIPQEMLLPPAHLDLVYHAAARRLTAGAEVSAYTVRGVDYARAAGIAPEGLQERIRGHLTAELSEHGCG
jgi:hypothetical protein